VKYIKTQKVIFFLPGRNETTWQIGGLTPLTCSLGNRWSWEARCTVQPFYPGEDLPRTYGKYLCSLPVLVWMHFRKEGRLAVRESDKYSQSWERIPSTHKLLVLQAQLGCRLQACGLVTVPWGRQRETYPSEHSILRLRHLVILLLRATV